VGYTVLGDAAYPWKSWPMKPFTDNGRLTPQQLVYNQKTSRARVFVENGFGRLKEVFAKTIKSLVMLCSV